MNDEAARQSRYATNHRSSTVKDDTGRSGRYVRVSRRREDSPLAIVRRLHDGPTCDGCGRRRHLELMARIVGATVELANVCRGCEVRGRWAMPRFDCLHCGRELIVGDHRLRCEGCDAVYPPTPLFASMWVHHRMRRAG